MTTRYGPCAIHAPQAPCHCNPITIDIELCSHVCPRCGSCDRCCDGQCRSSDESAAWRRDAKRHNRAVIRAGRGQIIDGEPPPPASPPPPPPTRYSPGGLR